MRTGFWPMLWLALASAGLFGQTPRERDLTRLTNWPAPLYWQADRAAESESAAPQAVSGGGLKLGSAALVFVAMTPCRLVDTRAGKGFSGSFGPPSLLGGQIRSSPVRASTNCPIAAAAQAYSFNVTAVPQGSLLYLTVYPDTANPQPAPPYVSTLNAPDGSIVANAAIVAAGTDGEGGVDVYATGPTDLILDINGYYSAVADTAGNLALGTNALSANSNGFDNTAVGNAALASNTGGGFNTASGFGALTANTTGLANTATGAEALRANTTGGNNTADGFGALFDSTTGSDNTAVGWNALFNNTTGSSNSASGYNALHTNLSGNYNTAAGANALYAATGDGNTALGYGAGQVSAFGSYSIAIGYMAATNVASGVSNNIHIGNPGALTDNGVIRIGNPTSLGPGNPGAQTSFFAAGIRGVTTGNNDAIPVVIDSNGQLGTLSSSARFKEDIRDMGDASGGLQRLRPVTFRYRQPFADGGKPLQYGLIAEEVEKVYPELVAHSADGRIESVRYQLLDLLLLNELQKQAERIRSLEERLAAIEILLAR